MAAGEQQWRRRPVLALLITTAVKLLPIAASFGAGVVAGRLVGRPAGWPATGLWLAGLLVTSTLVLVVVDRLARRALPLATLLRLTLLVPDRTPSRFKIAMGARGGDGPGADAARLLGLVADLDGHDRRSRGHSERVRGYVDLMAQELRLGHRDRELLRWAALLHDVGKLKVPSPTLERPGRLTDADWRELRQHPVEGARLIAPLRSWLGPWASAVVQHHERWDGTGYPGGLAGLQISLGARIVAVADAFETMTSARSGSSTIAAGPAREELARCAGHQFDPIVVRAFLRVSIGRLRWVMGPLAWIAEQPFLGGVQQAATRVGTVGARVGVGVATAGAVAGSVVVGVAPAPSPRQPGQVATSQPAAGASDERGVIDVFLHHHVAPGPTPSTTTTAPAAP
ncbi:MAG: domain/HD domain protein [Actinomycetia bacterium]|nr:domain/HD domain protein [Actinomycetes bacterium]